MRSTQENLNVIASVETKAARSVELVKLVVEEYGLQMKEHPLAKVMAAPEVSRKLLEEYAGLQYVDSILWVPMLAIMKDRAKNPRLVKALTDNILCEAGAKHTSHVTLCMNFIKSIGLTPFYGNFEYYSKLAQHPIEMMNAVSGMSEAQIAGWALVAEAVVPSLFSMTVPAYSRLPGVDMTYLNEHIQVDSDEHAQWMLESVEELVSEGTPIREILAGVHLGGRTALSIPDALYAKYLRGEYGRSV